VVFNGSALGKPYSASAILERLSINADTVTPAKPDALKKEQRNTSTITPPKKISQESSQYKEITRTTTDNHMTSRDEQSDQGLEKVIGDLIISDNFDPSSPEAALRLGRKKRKKKGRKL